MPRRLRVAPGDAPRPRVRHARGPRADRARQRPGAHAPQRDERHLRARPVRRRVRVARGAAGRPRLRHARHLAAGARRQPDGRGPAQRAARQGRDDRRPGAALLGARRRHQRRDGPRRAVRAGRQDAAKDLARARAPQPDGLGGELLFYRTALPRCGPTPDSVIRVQDPSSRRWSSPRPVATGCAGRRAHPNVLGPIARGGRAGARVAWVMHAIRLHAFGPAENLRYEQVDDPRPGPGQARIAVAAAGVHLIDTVLREGRAMARSRCPSCRRSRAREVAGVVDAVGPAGRRAVARPAGGRAPGAGERRLRRARRARDRARRTPCPTASPTTPRSR